MRTIFLSLVSDRLLALLGFIVVAAAAWYWLFGEPDRSRGGPIAVVTIIAALATVGALWLTPALASSLAKRWQRLHALNSLAAMFRFTVLSRAGALGIALSCIVVALTINAVTLFGLGFGVDIAPSVAFLVVPVAVIFSSLPISIGGWGIREASLSYGLTLFGKAPADAAMVGLALGIGLLVSSLPGGIAVLALSGKRTPDIAVRQSRLS
jgi:glycosyltransferase 2 family protein